MKFEKYTRDELEKCGEAFKTEFAQPDFERVRDWTQAVFEWFSKTKAEGIRVFCHPDDSEFLVDLCHTTYPDLDRDKLDEKKWERWKRALDNNRCQIRLAMECEWGKCNNENESFCMIFDDAWKLAAIRAQVKVMIFSSQAGRDRNEITKRLRQLYDSSADVVPWLWIDVPWRVKTTGIDWGLLTES